VVVRIVYFAWVREAVGCDEEAVDVPPDLTTAAQVARHLATLSAGHARAFADLSRIRCAADHVMRPLDAPLGSPTELAFFPPVTGG
jgi:sulfur-carrier protein